MAAEVVPDEHDRGAKLLVGGVEQGGEVRLAEAFLLTLASFVDHDAVDEPAALSRPVAGQPGDRDAARSLAGDLHDRCLAAGGPGSGLGWSQRLSRLVGEADPRTQPARDPFTAGHWCLRHDAIAASSRSTARWLGICGVQPIRRNSSDAPLRL